jgi:pimeloyl-ACP methyl ester carboxylesterase
MPASRSVGLRAMQPVAAVTPVVSSRPYPSVAESYWKWRDYDIRYQFSGSSNDGEALVLVHGFGANADHWRKNTAQLARKGYRVYAIDLLGYGYSSKPDPRKQEMNSIYNFSTWGEQLVDFVEEVVGQPSFMICNSVGGLSGMEACVSRPDLVKGVQLINVSLRGMNVKRTGPVMTPLISSFQRLLRETDIGKMFFGSVATEKTVKEVLKQAYGRKDAVTDELVSKILTPGKQEGAVNVFLDFISYSSGPLPEELLSKMSKPVSMLWGEKDPWEDPKLGRTLLSGYPCVQEFVLLPGLGHCPMDEAPEVVNPLIENFVESCK